MYKSFNDCPSNSPKPTWRCSETHNCRHKCSIANVIVVMKLPEYYGHFLQESRESRNQRFIFRTGRACTRKNGYSWPRALNLDYPSGRLFTTKDIIPVSIGFKREEGNDHQRKWQQINLQDFPANSRLYWMTFFTSKPRSNIDLRIVNILRVLINSSVYI